MATPNNAFDPFRELDRFFTRAGRPSVDTGGVPMDVYRKGDDYVIKVDLPGVDPNTVDVDVEERTITIRAQRQAERGEDIQWLNRERPVGTFARQVTVGDGLALDKAHATFEEGVLTLSIPVAEAAKPRKISITHNSAPAHEVVEGESTEQTESAEQPEEQNTSE